jgi:uroporphyrinogen-III synthase
MKGSAGSSREPMTALEGVKVAVTRPAEAADELADLLRQRGARPLVLPLLQVLPPVDPAPLQQAAGVVREFDWVVFTSPNAVRFLHDALMAAGAEADRRPARVAVVGPGTGRAVAELLQWPVDAIPDEFTGDAVAAAMGGVAPLRGARVLWPRARAARDALSRDLLAAGVFLHAPEAYRTEPVRTAAVELRGLLERRQVDAITFTSPSAVHCLAVERPRMDDVVVAVIGPVTGRTVRDHGYPVHVEPDQHTIPALVAALERHYRGHDRREGR